MFGSWPSRSLSLIGRHRPPRGWPVIHHGRVLSYRVPPAIRAEPADKIHGPARQACPPAPITHKPCEQFLFRGVVLPSLLAERACGTGDTGGRLEHCGLAHHIIARIGSLPQVRFRRRFLGASARSMAFSASTMASSRVLPCPDILTPAIVAVHFQRWRPMPCTRVYSIPRYCIPDHFAEHHRRSRRYEPRRMSAS
jgi:hypothetical protein